MVDNMGDGMMEAMELKNGKICDNSYSICWGGSWNVLWTLLSIWWPCKKY